MAKKNKVTKRLPDEKKSDDVEEFLQKVEEFDNHDVIETEEATVIVHHNDEDQFWKQFDGLKIGKGNKTVGSIEKEMSSGTKAGWDLWKYEITKLTRDERIAWATLKDCPMFGEIVRDLIRSKRNEKGWLEKKLFRYFAEHMKAFTSVYHNKNVEKAISKLNNAMNR